MKIIAHVQHSGVFSCGKLPVRRCCATCNRKRRDTLDEAFGKQRGKRWTSLARTMKIKCIISVDNTSPCVIFTLHELDIIQVLIGFFAVISPYNKNCVIIPHVFRVAYKSLEF